MSDPGGRLAILMAIGGLVLKRKEIAAHIHQQQYEVRKLVTELDAVDAAIRSHDPKSRLVPVVPPPRAFCGQQRLVLLTLLQETNTPLTTRQLALGLMLHRGLPTTDLKLVRQTIQRCNLCLQAMKRQNEADCFKDGETIRWGLPSGPNTGDAA
ncbi:MAG: hypothetical protein WAU68_16445 [Vitreimonas sp.]